jgi:hypothetical protein
LIAKGHKCPTEIWEYSSLILWQRWSAEESGVAIEGFWRNNIRIRKYSNLSKSMWKPFSTSRPLLIYSLQHKNLRDLRGPSMVKYAKKK